MEKEIHNTLTDCWEMWVVDSDAVGLEDCGWHSSGSALDAADMESSGFFLGVMPSWLEALG